MGTRHKIKVIYNGELKVNQYGQWDGYPTGQGADVLKFCRSPWNMRNLVDALRDDFISQESDTKFLDNKEIESLNKVLEFASKLDTPVDELLMANLPFTRDLGSRVLYRVAFGTYGTKLLCDNCIRDEDEDRLFVEGIYTIDIRDVEGAYIFEVRMDWHGDCRTYTDIDLLAMSNDEIDRQMKEWEEADRKAEECGIQGGE